MGSGVNIGKNLTIQERKLVYLKNACVALVSAKRYNSECDVALITNLDDNEIPSEIHEIFSREDIKIFHIPFDNFILGKYTPWGLDLYKLCALDYIINKMSYDNFLYVDADVYVQGSLAPVWEEVQENILLYDINEGLNVPDYVRFLKENREFYPEKKFFTRYGGEFFAANREKAKEFIEASHEFVNRVKLSGREFTNGAEVVYSIVADKFRHIIKNAGGYIFRFWTGDFWLVSSCYRWNAVTILHMPAEKERGLMRIYKEYILKGKLPANKEVWKICRLSGSRYTGRSLKGKIKLFIKEHLLTGKIKR